MLPPCFHFLPTASGSNHIRLWIFLLQVCIRGHCLRLVSTFYHLKYLIDYNMDCREFAQVNQPGLWKYLVRANPRTEYFTLHCFPIPFFRSLSKVVDRNYRKPMWLTGELAWLVHCNEWCGQERMIHCKCVLIKLRKTFSRVWLNLRETKVKWSRLNEEPSCKNQTTLTEITARMKIPLNKRFLSSDLVKWDQDIWCGLRKRCIEWTPLNHDVIFYTSSSTPLDFGFQGDPSNVDCSTTCKHCLVGIWTKVNTRFMIS